MYQIFKLELTTKSGNRKVFHVESGLYFFGRRAAPSQDSERKTFLHEGTSFQLELKPNQARIEFKGPAPIEVVALEVGKVATFHDGSLHFSAVPTSRDYLWQTFMQFVYQENRGQEMTEPRFQEILKRFLDENHLPNHPFTGIYHSIQYQLIGLGPLERFLQDPEITEIMVQGTQPICIERAGSLESTDHRFESIQELLFTCEKSAVFIQAPFSRSHPVCEGTWTSGQRIELIHHSIAPDGPLISVRKYKSQLHSLDQWLEGGGITQEQYQWLSHAVENRRTLIIAGPTGAGKTTLLQGLAHLIPCNQRWISIEDTPEISLRHPGRVRLLTRTANQDGHGSIEMDALIKASLRLRPDRLVIGEVRGKEALYLVQALSTGHEGSLATLHARTSEEALLRLILMAGMHPQAPPSEVLSKMIQEIIDGIVIVNRERDGTRKVTEILDLRESTRRFSGSPKVFDLGHLEGNSIVSRPENSIREDNHDKLAVITHGDRGIDNVSVGR